MSINSEAVATARRKRKQDLVNIMGGHCSLCGYNNSISALEFHHINPEQKELNISASSTHEIEKTIKEIQKCILVCANCHREIHDGKYSQTFLLEKQSFSQKKAEKLIQETQFNKKKHYFCKQCGKEISNNSKSGLCEECFHLSTRVVQNRPSREELKSLIRKFPFTDIGRKYSVSDNAIRKWCKSENLPSTKNEIKKYSEEEWNLL